MRISVLPKVCTASLTFLFLLERNHYPSGAFPCQRVASNILKLPVCKAEGMTESGF